MASLARASEQSPSPTGTDRAAERKRLAKEMGQWYEAQIRLALSAQRKRTFEELRALP
jgi:hypothetical protein